MIDADALAKFIDYGHLHNPNEKAYSENDIREMIDMMPTVDAVPVRHGNWIVWDEVIAGIYHTVSECSECGFTTDKMFREEMPHCPNCGAKMDAKRKEHDTDKR